MKLNIKQKFIHFYYEFFQTTNLYKGMQETKESTPWHRERSVATHTDMVVANFLTMEVHDEVNWLYGALVSAFHDVGKPFAEETKHSNERGSYNSYHGHELISAREWENFAVENYDLLQEYFPDFNTFAIYSVAWLIEHHLPFSIKKPEKVQMLVDTSSMYHRTFTQCLISDCMGRLSDNHETKIRDTYNWCEDFICNESNPRIEIDEDGKILYMLIGVCGSGKSTFKKSVLPYRDEIINFSLDDLREEWYIHESERGTIDGYEKAFQLSCEDKEFINKMFKVYVNLLKTGKNIMADNMNVSVKRRKAFLAEARKHGYQCVAITFPNTLSTLIKRQKTRTDKTVPNTVVINTYRQLQQPSLSEFDDIRIIKTF